MRKLILVKHSAPHVVQGVPPSKWVLSDDGQRRCEALAARLKPCAPSLIVTSSEAKARQTGKIVADALAVPVEMAAGLHEHDRDDVPHMPSREFLSYMALVFAKRSQRVLGNETADEAMERFSAAIEATLQAHPEGNIVVVSHGTVISLFAARHSKEDGYRLWRRMGLPSFIVMDAPDYAIAEVVEAVV
jgi:broad specificity phosphatase PhoE